MHEDMKESGGDDGGDDGGGETQPGGGIQ
jgi:hypothetical protein